MFLKDRYRAQQLLGQGGFGKTFRAVDEYQSNKPLCVIKQFTFNTHNPKIRQTALDLFYEEAKHLETLGKHEQIPELFAYFDLEDSRTNTLNQVRDYLAINIGGGLVLNVAEVASPLANRLSIVSQPSTYPNNHPTLQPFGFETAKLANRKTLWGTSKLVVKKSQGLANRFFQDLGGGVRLQMVSIPAGTFLMGAPELEKGSSDYQRPQHRVSVASFYMGKYPVTQAQYEAVMGSRPSYFQGGDRPVETVSWHDAVEFCQKLSQLTARHYRLPSEAEWEYACRAGTTTAFCFGETIDPCVVNYRSEETTVVGIFPANSYGLYDMHGNILEWCADNYHGNYTGAPTDGSVWSSDGDRTYVLRGGCWYSKMSYCRSAARIYYQPNYRCSYFGFRIVWVGGGKREDRTPISLNR
jgi:formylglycine-generating enzyme required for sulfatase activity